MKIIEQVIYYIEHEGKTYTRYSPSNWVGYSDSNGFEPLQAKDCTELEKIFQEELYKGK